MSPNLPNICEFYSTVKTSKNRYFSAAFRTIIYLEVYGEMKIQKKKYIYAT